MGGIRPEEAHFWRIIMGVAVRAGQGSKPPLCYRDQPESGFEAGDKGQYGGEYFWWQVCTESTGLSVHAKPECTH